MGKADIFMGNYKLAPDFESASAGNMGWYRLVGGTGEINIQVAYVPSHVIPSPQLVLLCIRELISTAQNNSLSIEAFDLLKVIGKGTFGKVHR
jgi:serum/glucocorticoid-regulated kinase 2